MTAELRSVMTGHRRYSAQSADEVMVGCRRVTAELIEGTWALPDEDLLDPARQRPGRAAA
jgi:hypothetical protein